MTLWRGCAGGSMRRSRGGLAWRRDLFSAAADRLFRRDRFRARDRLAGAGFAGTAVVSGYRAGRIVARSFDPLTDAAADGCGDASGSVRLGAEDFGRARLAERADAGD